MFKIDLFSQQIVSQLNLFYDMEYDNEGYAIWKDEARTKHRNIGDSVKWLPCLYAKQVFRLDLVYDFLEKEEKKIEFPPDIKSELWAEAQIRWKGRIKKELTKEDELHVTRSYKALLVAKHLLSKLPERLYIYHNDKKITQIEFTLK